MKSTGVSTTAGTRELASNEQARELVMEEGEEVGAGRAEGSPATGGGGQAVTSLTADADRTQLTSLKVHNLKLHIRGLSVRLFQPCQCQVTGHSTNMSC